MGCQAWQAGAELALLSCLRSAGGAPNREWLFLWGFHDATMHAPIAGKLFNFDHVMIEARPFMNLIRVENFMSACFAVWQLFDLCPVLQGPRLRPYCICPHTARQLLGMSARRGFCSFSPALGAGGRRFKSYRPDQISQIQAAGRTQFMYTNGRGRYRRVCRPMSTPLFKWSHD